MSSALRVRMRTAFAPPRYLAQARAGIDISTSGVKAVRLATSPYGLMLASYAETLLPPTAFTNGEIVYHAVVVENLMTAATTARISSTNAALSESKSYLFETTVSGNDRAGWRTSIEQRLDELVPLPPALTSFDFVEVGHQEKSETLVMGIGFAQRIVDETLSVFDEVGIQVRALEGENSAIARALLPVGDETTVLIIDVGKTTTKISIVSKGIPRFATTIAIGGHALTLAVQKYFGVTDAEAKKVKAERGIVPALGNEEYLAAMLSTVSAN